MQFTLKATGIFTDAESGLMVNIGDLIATKDEARVRKLIEMHLAVLKAIHPTGLKKHGKDVMVFHKLLYVIGGAETALVNMARAFYDRKITFVFQSANLEQALKIGQYCDVYIDGGEETYQCDVLILTLCDAYGCVKGRVKARKIYQQVHADWASMKKNTKEWRNFTWRPDSDVDATIAVSETAQKGLKTAFRTPIASKVVRNIILKPERPHRTFLSLTRLTSEKGAERIVAMVKRFHEEKRDFTWFIAATPSASGVVEKELANDESVVFIKPGIHAQGLIQSVDYLIQLSDTESYCYSVHEALLIGKPCICTRIPEFTKIIKDGENGYLVRLDLKDLDTNKIFDHVPTPKPEEEDIDPEWDNLLDGKI